MIFRATCTWHGGDPVAVECEFQCVPGPIQLRVIQTTHVMWCNGKSWNPVGLLCQGWCYFTSRNEIRCDSEWGPVLGVLDLERKAVRMRHFPYQIEIPDGWHPLVEDRC
jgi:hypothetical protein